ncbi:uncharacterized protein FIBRA_05949 [Fibroporia radiculosa]|uniref:BTB domain-containing protein n=1 Tax=Fibroporia radiculosa TaxID=599839 RepID=J4IB01_9APHY|nr:uncharacterized protein FIBRA_05949 [Fibroporia radiculosa]CCM03801.1 predicted protein [Fibroporia radiculosa]
MGYMTVQQDAVDFDISVRFKLDNLQNFLCTDGGDTENDSRMSAVFWPGYMLKVSRFTEGSSKQRKCRLSLYTLAGDRDAIPAVVVCATVNAQSLGGYSYFPKPLTKQAVFDNGRIALGTLLSQRTYETSSLMQEEDAVIVHVSLRSSNTPTPRATPTLNLIHRVLTAQPLSNTRFIAFRRRDSVGHLSCPRVFHANMGDLTSHYERLEGLLETAESMEGFELPRDARLDEYTLACEQYEHDSDFEPEEDEDEEDGDMVVIKSEPRKKAAARDRPKPCTKTLEDSLVAEGAHVLDNSRSDANASMYSSSSSFDVIQHKNDIESDLYTNSDFDGTTIVLLGTASRTWEALLYYLYTGFIEFAPFRMQNTPRQNATVAQHNGEHVDRPTPPSCRSIYRLAHKLELEGLRKLALQFLESQLTPDILLTEVFSEFTARYEEIKEMELALVVRYWSLLKSSAAFKDKMVQVTSGRVPFAADIISEIMLRVSAKNG